MLWTSAASSASIRSGALAAAGNAALVTDEQAPICDAQAASIAASPDVREGDDGRVEELPCDVLLKLWGWGKDDLLESDGNTAVARHAAPPRPLEISAAPQRPEASIEVAVILPDLGASAPLPESMSDRLRGLRGHHTAIFRPPLAWI
jgi:hypothetical protein